MTKPTLEERIQNIAQAIRDESIALDECEKQLQLAHAIESANAREIDKLKRHVAELQRWRIEAVEQGHPAPPTEV